jgi:hypothetical protein
VNKDFRSLGAFDIWVLSVFGFECEVGVFGFRGVNVFEVWKVGYLRFEE